MARSFSSGSHLTGSAPPVSTGPMTIACWFYRDTALFSTSEYLVGIGKAGPVANYNLELGIGSTVRAVARNGGSDGIADSGTFSNDTWNHAVAVFATDTSRTAYLNGVAGTENTNNVANPSPFVFYSIGANLVSGNAFGGRIAEVAIWDVAISEDEISQLAAGFSPFLVRSSDLVAYYPSDEGIGATNTIDRSINTNDGLLNGSIASITKRLVT